MPPLPIVEDFQPFTNRRPCLSVGAETALRQELTFAGGEEPFHHGVGKAIADGPQRGMDPRGRTSRAQKALTCTDVY
jgi:hypothetical protein